MPARHLSSVLLPEPLRPAMPKNSPRLTSKEMSLKAEKDWWLERRSGCRAVSLTVCVRSSGTRKVLLTERATIGGVPWLTSCGMGEGYPLVRAVAHVSEFVHETAGTMYRLSRGDGCSDKYCLAG